MMQLKELLTPNKVRWEQGANITRPVLSAKPAATHCATVPP